MNLPRWWRAISNGCIQALSPTSVWLSTRFGGSQPPTIYHFDGETWNSQNLSSLGGLQIFSLTDFQMVSASEGWAAGYELNIPAGDTVTDTDILARAQPLLLHYHDGAWTIYQQVG